jgi:hypothetical protein
VIAKSVILGSTYLCLWVLPCCSTDKFVFEVRNGGINPKDIYFVNGSNQDIQNEEIKEEERIGKMVSYKYLTNLKIGIELIPQNIDNLRKPFVWKSQFPVPDHTHQLLRWFIPIGNFPNIYQIKFNFFADIYTYYGAGLSPNATLHIVPQRLIHSDLITLMQPKLGGSTIHATLFGIDLTTSKPDWDIKIETYESLSNRNSTVDKHSLHYILNENS